ncbi:MAG: hypothetical protein WC141_09350, partial [Arcobacteraceae bacterium]
MSLEERSQNLLLLDLSKFPFISKGDIRKCIRYNEGEEVAFAENGLYYDVPERLLFLIKPF